MQYISTRGRAAAVNFRQAALTGLAADGGLYMPATWRSFTAAELQSLRDLEYEQLASRVIARLIGDDIAPARLAELIGDAYRDFPRPIAPLKTINDSLYLLELFHGPTFAFKDFALQFLARLYGMLLNERGRGCTIIGATSGDTGSAAIAALRDRPMIELYMLHPAGRVSTIQRKQMTTVAAANVHNLAVAGDFDACQNIVKSLFNDAEFRETHSLAAVNSINWARIAAQAAYYFYAWQQLGAPMRPINFAVPSGNFGNTLAGYVARELGLPVARFIIGSNANDILTRFFTVGQMRRRPARPTISPSMDIQVSSNVERYLFELHHRDGDQVRELMRQFAATGEFTLANNMRRRARQLFSAYKFSDAETRAEIHHTYRATGEMLDPHTAIGVAAARQHNTTDAPTVALGTAHPAKFADAVVAACGRPPLMPDALQTVLHSAEKMQTVANDANAVKKLIARNAES